MPDPRIIDVVPPISPIGSEILLKGENFNDVSRITFSGVSAENFTVISDREIKVIVPKNIPEENQKGNINVKVKNSQNKGDGKGKFKLGASASSPVKVINESTGSNSGGLPEMTDHSLLTPPTKTSASHNPRDLDRDRANAAWLALQGISKQDSEYGSLAREMPTLIQINGLAQTLAFLKAKSKEHHQKMFNHLSDWVCQRFSFPEGDLLSNALRLDSQSYRRATAESLAFLQWIKRFAEAVIEKDEKKSL